MRHKIIAQRSNSIIKLYLDYGEKVRYEPGSIVATSSNVTIHSKSPGGFVGAMQRAAREQNFFVSTLQTPPAERGEAYLASAYPGEIKVLELDGNMDYLLQTGSFLASRGNLDNEICGARFKEECTECRRNLPQQNQQTRRSHNEFIWCDHGDGTERSRVICR
ncbi:MAG: AIM24 family protein [Candidatus Caenarcaniphilales bacterium]|nr:AIM24 family protein [Candidatus Caenarcaniphilales bacterium]